MHESHWFLTHHVVSIVTNLLVLGFVLSLLRQRRPVGSAIAWLLAVVLIPYLGIPLYLVFGGRKLSRAVARKQQLDHASHRTALEARAWTTLARVEWLDDGVLAYDTFLSEILGAK